MFAIAFQSNAGGANFSLFDLLCLVQFTLLSRERLKWLSSINSKERKTYQAPEMSSNPFPGQTIFPNLLQYMRGEPHLTPFSQLQTSQGKTLWSGGLISLPTPEVSGEIAIEVSGVGLGFGLPKENCSGT
ncbi:high mobility group protein 20A [Platysternon megacephalum]|uniref:High mobility group protein 20A n=1 Tax=Platysternon megacephalum TaxID=55544 RepID=A0A4D9ECB2_9SAUR|nr:high mobility group protein 20A [Platysternon megacephalum]